MRLENGKVYYGYVRMGEYVVRKIRDSKMGRFIMVM